MTTENTLPPEEVNRVRRGHRFYPLASELVDVPRIYGSDKTPVAGKVLHLHYFGGPADWWLAEYDPKSRIGFGYACLGDPQLAEWGYVSLEELETLSVGLVIIERDLHWTPRPVSAVDLPGRGVH